jgi:hypothetical protein
MRLRGNARTCLHSRRLSLATCWPFVKPSDGLEPSTPPYHALLPATGGNPWQQFWRESAVLAAARLAAACHQLQPQGSIEAPSFVVS